MGNYEGVKLWRRNTKLKLIEAFGGKCSICGYNRSPAALGFHHFDPAEKEFSISGICKSWEKILIEARKCALVCSNCHTEIHEGITSVPSGMRERNIIRTNELIFDDAFSKSILRDMFSPCPICEKQKPIKRITCSRSCAAKMRYNLDWDSIDLVSLYGEIGTYSGVARKLGVSHHTIAKRIRKLRMVGSSNGQDPRPISEAWRFEPSPDYQK